MTVEGSWKIFTGLLMMSIKKSPPPTIACKGRIGWKHKMYEMRLTTLSEKDSNLKNSN